MKNPVRQEWYADPESRVYGDTVYMYVTKSLPFAEQLNLDVVMTKDLETYTVCRDILDMPSFAGVTHAVWAPTVIDRNGKYYLMFAANNIMTEEEVGGLYIGVADAPTGPFTNVFADGRPLINRIYCGAQPIDAHFFKDDDGTVYLYYGGWKHMLVCIMNATMDGFLPMPEPAVEGVVREITPADYVEAPFVQKIDGKYHLLYSSGKWGDGSYCVKAGVSESPLTPFTFYADILKAAPIADGPGHNSAFVFEGKEYVAYHRRRVGDTYKHNRQLCVDELPIVDGAFAPVTMT